VKRLTLGHIALFFLIVLGLAIIGLFLFPVAITPFEIDRCLDHGGAWDYEAGACRTE
jgi:hypothetical protein